MSDNDLDLPFEEIPGGPVSLGDDFDPILAGGLVVRAAIVPSRMGPLPSLVFDFHLVDGTPGPPIAFICEADQMGKVSALIDAAVRAAIAGAEAAR